MVANFLNPGQLQRRKPPRRSAPAQGYVGSATPTPKPTPKRTPNPFKGPSQTQTRPGRDPWKMVNPPQGAPAPLSVWDQAQKTVQGLTTPILDEYLRQKQYDEQQAAAQNRASLAMALDAYARSRPEIAASYSNAAQGTAATEAGLQKALEGHGGEAADALKAQLAQIGGPQDAALLAKLQQTYTGAGAAGFALGGSSLNHILATGAAENAYQAKQPGFATEAAQGSLQEALRGIGEQYNTNVGKVKMGLPAQVLQQAQYLQGQQAAAEKLINDRTQKVLDRQAKAKLAVMALNQGVKRDIMLKKLDQQNRIELTNLEAQNRADLANLQAGYSIDQINARAQNQAANKGLPTYRDLHPPKKTTKAGSKDTVMTPGSAKRGRVISALESRLFVPKRTNSGKTIQGQQDFNPDLLGDTEPHTAHNVLQAINSTLRAEGIPINSPLGVQLRKEYLRRYQVPVGPMGNPQYGKKAPTRPGGP